MRRLILLLILVLVLVPWAAQAQTHPCEATPVTSGAAPEGLVTIGWCHDLMDQHGAEVIISSWTLYVNDVGTSVTVTTDGVRSASGLLFFYTTRAFTRGTYTLEVSAVNGVGESPRTPPFAFSVVAPLAVPTAPRSMRVPAAETEPQ